MKILVIGRNGQVARALKELGGSDVIAVGRPQADLADVSSLQSILQHIKPTIVINAAAYTAVDKAESESELAHAINAVGPRNLARLSAEKNIPLIHISTDYVFNGHSPLPYREDNPTDPINVYGASKCAGEAAVAELCPQHFILRTSWVFSPWGSNFVDTMLRLAKARASINVVDDQRGSPTYALDLAAAILAVARQSSAKSDLIHYGTYHVCGTGHASWCEFARETFRVAGGFGLPTATVHAITTAEYPTAARRPMNSRLDTAKFTSQFGHALPDWRASVADCVERIARGQRS